MEIKKNNSLVCPHCRDLTTQNPWTGISQVEVQIVVFLTNFCHVISSFLELIANEFDELVELHFLVITTPWAVGNVKSFQMFRDELELRQCYRPECMVSP
ncbi:hypothetical protein T03_8434 [Trichinella britovi]|uniref:Uncharacterized protein n=1 Tax=Trichinella britovi TaxID=45882 RepID=A0A0V1CTF8_TRIBR|nr:hypothetical protein T03_8434 [Trichinella britovi]